MLEEAKPYLAYSRKAVWLILSAIALSVTVVAGLLLHIAATQDLRAAQQTRHFVRVSLTEQEKALQRALLDNAHWGDAYAHLHLTTDVDWAYGKNNLGRGTKDLGVDYVAVFAPDGRQTYALVEGEIATAALASLSSGLDDLIGQARRLSPRGIANAVLAIEGEPVLAAAAIFSTGDDASIQATEGPPSVLIFAKKLTPQYLAALAEVLNLDELALPVIDPGREVPFLRTSDGTTAFGLKVSVPTPGHDMLMALIPWLLITAILFGMFLLFLALQGIKVANLSHAAANALAASNLALEQQAHIDVVTDLPNRAVFLNRLRKNLILSHGPSHVLFLDLDRFKPVNDCYGHAAGDEVLREVGARLRACVTATDVPARLGGDEFVILVENKTDAEVAALCTAIIDAVCRNMSYAGHVLTIGISIGIARISKPRDTIEAVMRRADAALYAAKAAGRTTYCFEQPAQSDERAVA